MTAPCTYFTLLHVMPLNRKPRVETLPRNSRSKYKSKNPIHLTLGSKGLIPTKPEHENLYLAGCSERLQYKTAGTTKLTITTIKTSTFTSN